MSAQEVEYQLPESSSCPYCWSKNLEVGNLPLKTILGTFLIVVCKDCEGISKVGL